MLRPYKYTDVPMTRRYDNRTPANPHPTLAPGEVHLLAISLLRLERDTLYLD